MARCSRILLGSFIPVFAWRHGKKLRNTSEYLVPTPDSNLAGREYSSGALLKESQDPECHGPKCQKRQ